MDIRLGDDYAIVANINREDPMGDPLNTKHDAIGLAFDHAAKCGLVLRGERASGRAIAKILGVHRAQYANYTTGQTEPRMSSVMQWLQTWRAAGYPPISFAMDTDGIAVSLAI